MPSPRVATYDLMPEMSARGVTDVIESGPGRVLAGLARKIEPSLKVHALTDGHALGDAKAALAT